ncbi:MAG: redoxin domain-containing protein [Bacteroidales bacterium]|nr:redoxin domain-containing protein [Bacteroidales bacterium]
MRLITVVFVFLLNFAFAQTTTIRGKAPSYAGDKIEVYTYSDYVTMEKLPIGNLNFDSDGNFRLTVETKDITLIFLDLYVFRGSMFLEPNQTYEISLPTKTLPTKNEKNSPFLEQNEIDIFIENGKQGDLNDIIGSFDLSLNRFIIKHVGFSYGDFRAQADTAAYLLDSVFSYNNSEFYTYYKKYKLRQLKQMAYRLDDESAIRAFFTYKKVKFNNPAYMELFNNVFQNFLINYSKTPKGTGLMEKILSYKSYYLLKKQLLENYFVFKNDSLVDLAILKGIHDGFTNFSLDVGQHKNQIPGKQLLTLLDSIYYYCPVEDYKQIALNIKEKYTRMAKGSPAPDFKLRDENGEFHSLKEFEGKYIYLNFTTSWNYSNQKEFDLIKTSLSKFKDSLQVVTIICDGEFEDFELNRRKKSQDWLFLYFENKEILTNYRVQIFPIFYVIDQKGKFFISPAKAPSEEFEKQFFYSFKKKDGTSIPWFEEVFEEKKD